MQLHFLNCLLSSVFFCSPLISGSCTPLSRVWTCPSLSTGGCGQELQQLQAPPSAVAPMLRCGRRGLPPSPAKTEPTCAGGHLLESRSPAAGLLNKASLRSDRRSPGELLAQLLAEGTVSGNEALQRCRSPRRKGGSRVRNKISSGSPVSTAGAFPISARSLADTEEGWQGSHPCLHGPGASCRAFSILLPCPQALHTASGHTGTFSTSHPLGGERAFCRVRFLLCTPTCISRGFLLSAVNRLLPGVKPPGSRLWKF